MGLISLFIIQSVFASECFSVSEISPTLTRFELNGHQQNLTTKRVPCLKSIQAKTGKECGASGNEKNWTQFLLHSSDPHRSGSKRNELSCPPEHRAHNGETVTYNISSIIPKEGVYLLPKSEGKQKNTAMVLFQVKGTNALSPGIALRIRNDGKLTFTKNTQGVRPSIDGSKEHYQKREELFVTDIKPYYNKPTNFQFQVHWDPNNKGKGFIKGFINGRQIFSHYGPTGFHPGPKETTGNGAGGYYAKFGIYNSNKTKVPSDKTLSVCHKDFHMTVKKPASQPTQTAEDPDSQITET